MQSFFIIAYSNLIFIGLNPYACKLYLDSSIQTFYLAITTSKPFQLQYNFLAQIVIDINILRVKPNCIQLIVFFAISFVFSTSGLKQRPFLIFQHLLLVVSINRAQDSTTIDKKNVICSQFFLANWLSNELLSINSIKYVRFHFQNKLGLIIVIIEIKVAIIKQYKRRILKSEIEVFKILE